ncbi:MAG: tetratricopeptide repeat protein [Owenweeksia sp.]|nr:tetratricopeptide repeat protein [Owenweeksia sp.]
MQKVISIFSGLLLLVACQQNAPTDQDNSTPAKKEVSPAQQPPADRQYVRGPIDSISNLINREGESAQLLADRARLHLGYNNTKAALKDIHHALTLDSSLAEINEVYGEYHFMVNHSRKARDQWEKCIRRDPQNGTCLLRLAELYIAVQNYDRALELVNQQLQNNDKDPKAYFTKGIIIRDRNADTAIALQYFQNAIDLKQDYFEAIDMMAVTLTQQKDTLAKFYYDRLLEMQPNNADTYFKLGTYYQGQNEVNRALEAYTQAVKINPTDADSYYNLGYMHLQLDQYQKARSFFTKAIQSKERNYKAYYGRGYTYEVVGDLLNAKKDYEKSLEILSMYKPAGQALARVNRAINEQ